MEHCAENLSGKGGYILRDCQGKRQVTLIATGSEVGLAVEAYEKLQAEGIQSVVVSMPSWELFDQQSKSYQQDVLGDNLRIGIEAACEFGWAKYLGDNGIFIGMKSFGESAPAPELYQHFGITVDAVVKAVKERV